MTESDWEEAKSRSAVPHGIWEGGRGGADEKQMMMRMNTTMVMAMMMAMIMGMVMVMTALKA